MKIQEINEIINKKFKKCLAIGALATSLAITPIGSYINMDNLTTVEAQAKAKKSKKKIKLIVKRKKGNKKKKTLESGKSYKESYTIKLKNGRKKMKGKKYSVIIREKDKIISVTPKQGITNYSKKLGVKKKIIKKKKKASGIKVTYNVDPNVRMKLKEKVTIICHYIKNHKKHVKKKKITNIRYIEGNDYKTPITPATSAATTAPTQEEINATFEEETGEKINVVIPAPSTVPTFNPGVSVVEEDPNDVIYYDDNGNVISSPMPVSTKKPETVLPSTSEKPGNTFPSTSEEPANTLPPLPGSTSYPSNSDSNNNGNGNGVSKHGDMTVISDEVSYNKAEENLMNQTYGNGIVLNSIDPLISTLFLNVNSGLLEDNQYLDYLKFTAEDANKNDISKNIKVYDYYVKQAKENNLDIPVIIEVTDNNGNLYSQYLTIGTRNIENENDVLTGIVVEEEDATMQRYYEQFLLGLDPVVVAKTDSMYTSKDNIVTNENSYVEESALTLK